MGVALHLNKREAPFTLGCLVSSLVEIGQGVPEKILKFRQSIWLFRNYLPLENGVALHLNKLEFPFTQGCFVLSLVENDPVVLEKKIFKFRQCVFAIS